MPSRTSSKATTSAFCFAGVFLALVFAGCETPGWASRLNDAFSTQPKTTQADEERHREKYVATRDRQALNWLLRNRIESGMSYGGVCKVLGEEGVRESSDKWIKTRGGALQVGDDVYAFGPDNEGRTLYLGFRENRLVDFDPTEFSPSGPAAGKPDTETQTSGRSSRGK